MRYLGQYNSRHGRYGKTQQNEARLHIILMRTERRRI